MKLTQDLVDRQSALLERYGSDPTALMDQLSTDEPLVPSANAIAAGLVVAATLAGNVSPAAASELEVSGPDTVASATVEVDLASYSAPVAAAGINFFADTQPPSSSLEISLTPSAEPAEIAPQTPSAQSARSQAAAAPVELPAPQHAAPNTKTPTLEIDTAQAHNPKTQPVQELSASSGKEPVILDLADHVTPVSAVEPGGVDFFADTTPPSPDSYGEIGTLVLTDEVQPEDLHGALSATLAVTGDPFLSASSNADELGKGVDFGISNPGTTDIAAASKPQTPQISNSGLPAGFRTPDQITADYRRKHGRMTGKLTKAELFRLPDSFGDHAHYLVPEAGVALMALDEIMRKDGRKGVRITDSYRDLDGQYRVAAAKPSLAAEPGTSVHGLGKALDGITLQYPSKYLDGRCGWESPEWAHDGKGLEEDWHEEYLGNPRGECLTIVQRIWHDMGLEPEDKISITTKKPAGSTVVTPSPDLSIATTDSLGQGNDVSVVLPDAVDISSITAPVDEEPLIINPETTEPAQTPATATPTDGVDFGVGDPTSTPPEAVTTDPTAEIAPEPSVTPAPGLAVDSSGSTVILPEKPLDMGAMLVDPFTGEPLDLSADESTPAAGEATTTTPAPEKPKAADHMPTVDQISKLFPGVSKRLIAAQLPLVNKYLKAQNLDDPEMLAYAFATNFVEDQEFKPIPEGGRGRGRSYGKPHPITGKKYYGRGRTQLTWYDNYEKYQKRLAEEYGVHVDLIGNPDLMLDPQIDAMVFSLFLKDHEGAIRKGLKKNGGAGARETYNGGLNGFGTFGKKYIQALNMFEKN